MRIATSKTKSYYIRVNAISPLAQTRMPVAPPPAEGQVPVEKWPAPDLHEMEL